MALEAVPQMAMIAHFLANLATLEGLLWLVMEHIRALGYVNFD